ncbi:MAG TPA: antitoxin Xre/MbcA/ParS toxin-binding domain-containing protein [Chitinophagaceae bacterium]|nr:antitoxin Xre/MbcA/ParS toxin-binding domain-containing protein [Chitinophagaceae bacterium]
MSLAISTKLPQDLFKKYIQEISNPVVLVFTAGKGLEVNFFDQLLKLTGLNKKQLAAIIDTTPKTIDNRRLNRRPLGRIESEQLLQILALYKKGKEIFGTPNSFIGWLNVPAIGLGERTPFDLMHTPGGINLIMEELIRIEFGALA